MANKKKKKGKKKKPKDFKSASVSINFKQLNNLAKPVEKVFKTSPELLFKPNSYYRQDSEEKAPIFNPNNTWIPLVSEGAPSYEANKYYKLTRIDRIAPAFTDGDVYKKWLDHYAEIIHSVEDDISSRKSTHSQNVELYNFEADIGDIVGGDDYLTGYSISQPVTNIIVKCKNGIESFEYVVGGENG